MNHNDQKCDTDSNLKVAFLLNAGFTVIEIIGGLWTNSIAILTDSLHDGGDCLSLGLAWYLQRLARKSPDAKFTYGYRRFSTLGALTTGLVLIAGLVFVVWHAVQRLNQPEEVRASGMLGLAVVGIAFNGFAAWKLRHSHSLNEKVAGWHLIEDTMGWGAVLLGSATMMVWNLPIIDPVLSILISVFILRNVLGNLRKVLAVLIQQAPPEFDIKAFEQSLATIPGVRSAHHIHAWTLDGDEHVFSTHIVMDRASGREQILTAKRRIHELLRAQDFLHITVEVEIEEEQCLLKSG